MAQIAKHRTMDAVHSDLQKATLSVGAAGRTPGQLQGRSRSGHRSKEAVPQRGVMLSRKLINQHRFVYKSVL